MFTICSESTLLPNKEGLWSNKNSTYAVDEPNIPFLLVLVVMRLNHHLNFLLRNLLREVDWVNVVAATLSKSFCYVLLILPLLVQEIAMDGERRHVQHLLLPLKPCCHDLETIVAPEQGSNAVPFSCHKDQHETPFFDRPCAWNRRSTSSSLDANNNSDHGPIHHWRMFHLVP